MTVLDAFDLTVCDDAELGRRAAAGDARARGELIERYVVFVSACSLYANAAAHLSAWQASRGETEGSSA
jgi:hypothetical protein